MQWCTNLLHIQKKKRKKGHCSSVKCFIVLDKIRKINIGACNATQQFFYNAICHMGVCSFLLFFIYLSTSSFVLDEDLACFTVLGVLYCLVQRCLSSGLTRQENNFVGLMSVMVLPCRCRWQPLQVFSAVCPF